MDNWIIRADMNIEKADYGTIIKFGALDDLLRKVEYENDTMENIISILDTAGISLLEKSIISRKFDISHYLLNNGANVNIVSKEGLNEFHFLATNINHEGAVDIGKILLNRGVSVMQKESKYGNTAFFSLCIEAFKDRSEKVLEFLKDCLEKVTDVDDKNISGYSIRSLINERGTEELKERMEVKWKNQ